jgi:hypothetical protein
MPEAYVSAFRNRRNLTPGDYGWKWCIDRNYLLLDPATWLCGLKRDFAYQVDPIARWLSARIKISASTTSRMGAC